MAVNTQKVLDKLNETLIDEKKQKAEEDTATVKWRQDLELKIGGFEKISLKKTLLDSFKDISNCVKSVETEIKSATSKGDKNHSDNKKQITNLTKKITEDLNKLEKKHVKSIDELSVKVNNNHIEVLTQTFFETFVQHFDKKIKEMHGIWKEILEMKSTENLNFESSLTKVKEELTVVLFNKINENHSKIMTQNTFDTFVKHFDKKIKEMHTKLKSNENTISDTTRALDTTILYKIRDELCGKIDKNHAKLMNQDFFDTLIEHQSKIMTQDTFDTFVKHFDKKIKEVQTKLKSNDNLKSDMGLSEIREHLDKQHSEIHGKLSEMKSTENLHSVIANEIKDELLNKINEHQSKIMTQDTFDTFVKNFEKKIKEMQTKDSFASFKKHFDKKIKDLESHDNLKAEEICKEIKVFDSDLNKRFSDFEDSAVFSDLRKSQDILQEVREIDLDVEKKLVQIIEASITWSDQLERIQDSVNVTQDATLGNFFIQLKCIIVQWVEILSKLAIIPIFIRQSFTRRLFIF